MPAQAGEQQRGVFYFTHENQEILRERTYMRKHRCSWINAPARFRKNVEEEVMTILYMYIYIKKIYNLFM